MSERTKATLDGLLIGSVAFLLVWSLMLATEFEFWYGNGVIPLVVITTLLGAVVGWLRTGLDGKAPLPVPLRWAGVVTAGLLLAYVARAEYQHRVAVASPDLDSTLFERPLDARAKAGIVARVLRGANT